MTALINGTGGIGTFNGERFEVSQNDNSFTAMMKPQRETMVYALKIPKSDFPISEIPKELLRLVHLYVAFFNVTIPFKQPKEFSVFDAYNKRVVLLIIAQQLGRIKKFYISRQDGQDETLIFENIGALSKYVWENFGSTSKIILVDPPEATPEDLVNEMLKGLSYVKQVQNWRVKQELDGGDYESTPIHYSKTKEKKCTACKCRNVGPIFCSWLKY